MLQRIQTIWLFLAAACVLISLKISFFAGNIISPADQTIKSYLEVNGMYNLTNNILTITVAVMAIISVFLYSNRKLQMRLIYAAMVCELALMFSYESIIRKFTEGNYSVGSLLQLVVMIFFVLAQRGIRKDNKIIEESNRLR